MRTRSLRINAASATLISGEVNEIALASISGSRASAPKLQNMPTTLSTPRLAWPSGRSVRGVSPRRG